MPRKVTTLAGLQGELLKIVGDHGSVSCHLHRHRSVSPGTTYAAVDWSASVAIEDDGGNVLVRAAAYGTSAADVLQKIRANVRDALEQRARARRLTHRPRRIEGQRRLEYHPLPGGSS